MIGEVATLLQYEGIGTKATNLFIGAMPDAPHSAVCLYQYAGQAPEETHSQVEYFNPGLQVVVRDQSYLAAEAKINSIVNKLAHRGPTIIDGVEMLGFRANQSPFPLGPDANGRHRLAVNFTVSVRA